MDVRNIGNAVEVSGVDLENDEDCRELGRIAAHECVTLVRDATSEQRLFDIQSLWGEPAKALIHRYVGEQRLKGPHWRNLLACLGHVSRNVDGIAHKSGMSRVSFERDKKGRPTGVFPNGELDWHADQQSYHDHQRIVGLMSLWGSENSQTTFLCTAPVYEALNHEDRTMVDELWTVWEWDGGKVSEDLYRPHLELIQYNTVPYRGIENRLVDYTATGRKGIRYPSHCFGHFRGMSREESEKYRDHLWSLMNKSEYIYEHNWQDGEIMFFDQNITLHARPTNIKDGNTRTMCRMMSYVDKLFPGNGPADHILVDGREVSHDEFAQMVDAQRREDFAAMRAAQQAERETLEPAE